MKIGKLIFALLIGAASYGAYTVFVGTDYFVPSRKEVVASKQLKEEIVREISKQLFFKDTLYLVSYREIGVCGNENHPESFMSKIDKIRSITKNPYVLREDNYETAYTFNGKTIIVGSYNQLESSADSIHKIYDIQFPSVQKEKIEVKIFEEIIQAENKNLYMEFVFINSNWKFNRLIDSK